ncbi:uncharacterized protein STEHIDRAFT_108229 [Stereum hirsutum FP-91666 SS1]|uniref:uncharacterized protein n=1 Tax=Stereum hirsutum (strain FP-91666) TaxID=721885 RepID=UPI000440BC23|nr:uncharacterized protein STEHIDRAFT_108229 [Stereum hirsutum FP-91666 SS1]EIM89507.1 hypothetical protein STEHIDRAFT_108229 [Stereum hirsutum FP-91666 SS1]
MEQIPLELVSEILLLTQEELVDMQEWYDLRLVRSSWKRVIDGSPKLWRRVDTASGPEFVDKQVERAKGMNLWVQADISQRKVYGRTWVERHRGVIERLTLFVASDRECDSSHMVARMMKETHFPILRHFRVRREGVSSGRLASLPQLPVTFVHPPALSYLEFTGIFYPIPTLASNVNIRFLRLDCENSSFTISLTELQALLPILPALTSLTLGGSFDIESDDVKRPSPTLASLTQFSFLGKIEDLDLLLCRFLLPAVEHWRFRLKVGRQGIPSRCGLRRIVKDCAGLPTKVVLRWLSKVESTVRVVDRASLSTFSLKLIARRGAPFQTLSDLLGGVGPLPSVRDLVLHGGANSLDVCEPDDDVIDGVLEALRGVERVVVSGNGNSWVRVPVVLKRRLGGMDNLWENVGMVKFFEVITLPYTVKDWTSYLGRMKQRGSPLRVLKIRGWKIDTTTDWECETLAEGLKDVVVMVDGRVFEQSDLEVRVEKTIHALGTPNERRPDHDCTRPRVEPRTRDCEENKLRRVLNDTDERNLIWVLFMSPICERVKSVTEAAGQSLISACGSGPKGVDGV